MEKDHRIHPGMNSHDQAIPFFWQPVAVDGPFVWPEYQTPLLLRFFS
jgi:hypothetical protein